MWCLNLIKLFRVFKTETIKKQPIWIYKFRINVFLNFVEIKACNIILQNIFLQYTGIIMA